MFVAKDKVAINAGAVRTEDVVDVNWDVLTELLDHLSELGVALYVAAVESGIVFLL